MRIWLVLQFLEDVMREMLVDLAMTRKRLAGSSFRILIPIVAAAVADKDASVFLNLTDEVEPFHAI